MLRRELLVAALLGLACHVTSALQCLQCDENFGSQADCNDAGMFVECASNEVCQAELKCDGKAASFWTKGCLKATKFDELNSIVCTNNKCTLGCDTGDNCNENVPEDTFMVLKCVPPLGPRCLECPRVFPTQEACNEAAIEVDCANDEICTTDVHCDGPDRKLFGKGCKRRRQIAPGDIGRVVCNQRRNRCQFHCEGELCNVDTTPETAATLRRCNRPDPTTPTPEVGPLCYFCERVFESQDLCNAEAIIVQCEPDEICTTDVHCDGPVRKFFDKGCKRRRQIADGDIGRVVCNRRRNRCQYHCEGALCNLNAPETVATTLRRCNRGTDPDTTIITQSSPGSKPPVSPTTIQTPTPSPPASTPTEPPSPPPSDPPTAPPPDKCTPIEGDGKCRCVCTCDSECPVPE